MSSADDLRRLALALPGTTEVAHFDRRAFRARVIFATLTPDGLAANLKLSPAEQEFRCTLSPHGFAPLGNAWGRQGWTQATLAALAEDELAAALEAAWREAGVKRRK